MTEGTASAQWACPGLADRADASSCLLHSSGTRSLEDLCLQVTDLLPGLRKLRNLLPEHGCLLLSPANFWQNDRERFHADPDIIRTIHQHEPKTLQTSATLKGTLRAGSPRTLATVAVGCRALFDGCSGVRGHPFPRWEWGGAPVASQYLLASARRPAVWRAREVQRGEPLRQEEDGLVHHHPGLPALPCQVRPSARPPPGLWEDLGLSGSLGVAPGDLRSSGFLLKCLCPSDRRTLCLSTFEWR